VLLQGRLGRFLVADPAQAGPLLAPAAAGRAVDPAQFEQPEGVAMDAVGVDQGQQVGHQRRAEQPARLGDRVGKGQGALRLELQPGEPVVVGPAVVVDLGEAVPGGKQPPRLVLDPQLLVDRKRRKRHLRHPRLDLAIAIHPEHLFGDVWRNRDVLDAPMRRHADLERAVGGKLGGETKPLEDGDDFAIGDVGAGHRREAARRQLDGAKGVLQITGDRHPAGRLGLGAGLVDEFQNPAQGQLHVDRRLGLFKPLGRLGAEVEPH